MAPPSRPRIGLLGGTFDPVHVGHLVAGVNARHELSLDRVLFVVANEPWQKVGVRPLSPAVIRLEMVTAALDGVQGLEASDIEIARGGLSYTADTVAEVADRYPDADLFLVLGNDVAASLETWKRLDDIRSRCTLAIVTRPGASPDLAALDGWNYVRVEVPLLDVASTDLRARVTDGRPLDFLVPEAVIRLIEARGLYSDAPSA
jgi:nicotinate-nucleotide adenylyltransferase